MTQTLLPTNLAPATEKTAPWPWFTPEQIEAATAVLRSGKVNYWTGTECKEFEHEYAEHVGVQYAISAANGTVTLEMALKALGIREGDEIVVSPRSFMASVSCVITCGATPVFADVDRDSGNITAESIERALTSKTKAVIPVHLAGWPCEMDPIMDMARARGLKVIEDCAQAHGAVYRGQRVGSIGHVNSFSFCQDKIITTGGEGGLVTTNDQVIWERAWSLKEHGKSYDACFRRQWPAGFRWLHESFGSNYRMTEMQATIGRIALRQLPQWLAIRRAHSDRLSRALELPAVRVPQPPDYVQHARYKYYCYVNPKALRESWSRDRIMAELNTRGVPAYSGTCSEIYLETAFERANLRPKQHLRIARELGDTSLMFLVHPTISEQQMDRQCAEIRRVITDATR